jgi:hypothetical protein
VEEMTTEIVRRSQALALLVDLEQAGALGPTHLDLSARLDLGLETFEALARYFDTLHDLSQWAIADLLIEAESRFGESFAQVGAATRRSPQTLANWMWVASRIPRSRRREELSFSTHAEAAVLELEEQREFLDRAVVEGWSSREMRQAVKERRALAAGDRDPCGDLVAEMAVDLRAALRKCGLPDVDVHVEIRGGGFEYSVKIP